MKLFLLFLLPAFVTAQSLDLKSLEPLAAKATDSSDINLDGAALQTASQFLTTQKSADERVKKLISGITSVKVKTFEFEKKGQYSDAELQPIRAQLQGSGWSRIVDVKEKHEEGVESSQIYLRSGSNGQVNGLVVISAEPKELSIVQIMGTVSPQDLALLNENLGLPKMKLEMPHQKKDN